MIAQISSLGSASIDGRRQAGHGVGHDAADALGHRLQRRRLVRRIEHLVHQELALERLEHERALRTDDCDLDRHVSPLVTVPRRF